LGFRVEGPENFGDVNVRARAGEARAERGGIRTSRLGSATGLGVGLGLRV
jgi:hypothetical protein